VWTRSSSSSSSSPPLALLHEPLQPWRRRSRPSTWPCRLSPRATPPRASLRSLVRSLPLSPRLISSKKLTALVSPPPRPRPAPHHLRSLDTRPRSPSALVPLASAAATAPSTSGAVYPAGPAFHAHARRILNQRSFADDDRAEKDRLAANGNGEVVEEDLDADLGGEEEDLDLLELDPKKWKVRPVPPPEQCRAEGSATDAARARSPARRTRTTTPFSASSTSATTRPRSRSRRPVRPEPPYLLRCLDDRALTHAGSPADRRKVLRHHPDKKANATKGGSMDDSFFKCIAKGASCMLR